jgi:hypothetical protein
MRVKSRKMVNSYKQERLWSMLSALQDRINKKEGALLWRALKKYPH